MDISLWHLVFLHNPWLDIARALGECQDEFKLGNTWEFQLMQGWLKSKTL